MPVLASAIPDEYRADVARAVEICKVDFEHIAALSAVLNSFYTGLERIAHKIIEVVLMDPSCLQYFLSRR